MSRLPTLLLGVALGLAAGLLWKGRRERALERRLEETLMTPPLRRALASALSDK